MNSLGHAKPLNGLCFLLILLLWSFQVLHFIRSLSTTYCCCTKTTGDVSHGLAGHGVACPWEGAPEAQAQGQQWSPVTVMTNILEEAVARNV